MTAIAGEPAIASTRAPSGAVNLTIWSVDSDGASFQAIASGAIGDFGLATTVTASGKTDTEHKGDLKLQLKHGSFRLDIASLTSKLVSQASHEPMYAKSCSDYFHDITATVPVVTGSGTRAYKGLGGTFLLSVTGNEVQKSPPCGSQIARQLLLISGTGCVTS